MSLAFTTTFICEQSNVHHLLKLQFWTRRLSFHLWS
uniref:Uncharacterized protein n=1 Tax=Solanum lycopersicum TaxID=4081 RepID=A0A3Q7JD31_SOLLC